MTLSGCSTDSNDPGNFFRPLLSCAAIGSQTNYARQCDQAFDALLYVTLFSEQFASHIDACHEAQLMLAQQLPVLPLVSVLHLQAYHYGIRGLVLSSFDNTSFAGVYRDKRQEQTSR